MLKKTQEVEPGFVARRVTRPDPMQQWDAKSQAAIARDFDELTRELMAEHRAAAARRRDNQYASDLDETFRDDERRARDMLRSGWGPISFVKGTFLLGRSRFAQFCLGHEVLHGTYGKHSEVRFRGDSGWDWPLFIVDKHWRHGHNKFHHKMPGVFGLDPESSPVNYRGSTDFYGNLHERLTVPFSSFILAFETLLFIGIVEAKKYAEIDPGAWRELLDFNLQLAKKEFVDLPLAAGVKAPRVLAGNLASFVVAEVISGLLGRTTHIRDDAVCLHVNEFDTESRAHFYINSLLNAGNVDYPGDRAYIGGFDKHIEHHLFPFLSSRRLEDASERVRALCEKHNLPYREGSLWRILVGGVWLDLKLMFGP